MNEVEIKDNQLLYQLWIWNDSSEENDNIIARGYFNI